MTERSERRMGSYIKVIIEDLKRAFYNNRYRYLLVLVMITAMVLVPTGIAGRIIKNHPEVGQMNFIDNVFYMLWGAENIDPELRTGLDIPLAWMLIQFLCGFVTVDYVSSDQKEIGRDILLRTRSKTRWWFSKCICVTMMVLVIYVIMWAICAIVAGINYKISGGMNLPLLGMVCGIKGSYMYSAAMPVYIMVVPLICSLSVTLFQMALSQFVTPVIALVIVLSVDVVSAFTDTSLLWGNWSMILKSSLAVENGGISVQFAIVASIVLAVIGVSAGCIQFNKKDIL